MNSSKIKGPGLPSASFADLGLSAKTLKALKDRNFTNPTPIQEKVIPIILGEELDVIGKAQTGTGKTAAFGLPLLEMIQAKGAVAKHTGKPIALVLVPTRELAEQVAKEISSFNGGRGIRIAAIYGGQSIVQQLKVLRQGVEIVVGTPGRIMDHLERKTLNLSSLSYFVLDEADEMLNMGFIEDVEHILSSVTGTKRVFLFSATMPPRILNLVKKYMGKHKMVEVNPGGQATLLVDQSFVRVTYGDKFEALCRYIDGQPGFYGLIFCRTKFEVDELGRKLVDRGYLSETIHGDISQAQRERILANFKSKRINIMVATDVAARGIDINGLGHVINYSIPQFPESYVHRIGRTGRSGKEGKAVTFVTPEESRGFVSLKRFLKTEIRQEKLPKIEDIIRNQKLSIKEELAAMSTEIGNEYLVLAAEILGKSGEDKKDPKQIIATLLEYVFKDKLDPSKYKDIREVQEYAPRRTERTGYNDRFDDRRGGGERRGRTPYPAARDQRDDRRSRTSSLFR